ncbi:monovalent cation/H(+) antiporter subunit G [Alishewanella sp. d11]|uniref:monovalent cation/H(+) antiporter subunit G n=1 Tax=Alishewanella sp. d11 TaxID=3414030 RepID=UPI003BF800EA
MSQLPEHIPLWLGIPMLLLLLTGSVVTLIGALGLYRLPHFYQRIHGPAIIITLGTGCILLASMLFFSGLAQRPVLHELLITIFVLLTAPISAMLIMRAAVYRDLRNSHKQAAAKTSQKRDAQD